VKAGRSARLVGFIALAAVLLGGAVVLLALARPAAFPPITPPDPASFPASLVAHGAEVAHLAGCAYCHTGPNGVPFAGGHKLPTPFGLLYGPNITPDPATGIGRWSLEAFGRALRHGIGRDGHHIYPGLPYEQFQALRDEDVEALYAFVMSQPPVRQTSASPRLIPPLGFRPLLAIWNALFLRRTPPPADRGDYLVDVVVHCGACHTPRNLMGASETDRAFDGGESEGWHAPPLNASSPAHRAWTEDRLFTFLTTGFDPDHGIAGGPMGVVVHDLAQVPPGDVRAIARSIAGRIQHAPSPPDAPPIDRKELATSKHPAGAAMFARVCARCHETDVTKAPLSFSSKLHETDPRNAIMVVLQGLDPSGGRPRMPAFGPVFDDVQIAELAAYLRTRFSEERPWSGPLNAVEKARAQLQSR
jgi:mono/diheme cytochrome c family protein